MTSPPPNRSSALDVRRRWDDRYAASAGPATHAALLDELADLFPATGTMIDVAGGGGRNALWFARRGFDATLIDISERGLAHARARALDAELALETICRDVEAAGLPPGRRWHVALMHLYSNRVVLGSLPASLHEGGLLVFAQPTVVNLERHDRPARRFLLEVGEIESLARGLTDMEVVEASEGWRASGRHEGRLIARRVPAVA